MLIKKIYFCSGGLAERSIAAVLKTVEVLQPPGVRIPNPPQSRISVFSFLYQSHKTLSFMGFCF